VQLGFDVWACDDDETAVKTTRVHLADALSEEVENRVVWSNQDALGYPDTFADWVVLTLGQPERAVAALTESARVLTVGGWVWVEAVGLSPAELDEAAASATLAVAESPRFDEARGSTVGIYRRAEGAVG
jgi:hypothetical protein